MIIPNYIPITAEQYDQLTTSDPDDAVGLVFVWMEEQANGPGTDIDKDADDLAAGLNEETTASAVSGKTLLCQDPPLLVATPEETPAMAQALASASVKDEELATSLETLADFYASTAAQGHAVAIIYN
ncbi:hypothetical protein [Corynebacterium cystitidis]|uniref:Uncharacterized protein n=1 Tax=Corynebacterium cystitidis DSM 20524 TaxID=1121357 RepID=A0A1H9WK03_9CORY|nr:hypothetical protein [Corynebacterium cystitidis]WJY83433.1 hypothetical protein CCYS_12730 [Corynebacterium cystitidis DSM 20524]SES34266.1 hypothetical protein SAMN05661109_02779 [Corynebacterium cystitidis DSM 20524]SNV61663.1 Uncharacterised protein [Corynebacterium cystitidis]